MHGIVQHVVRGRRHLSDFIRKDIVVDFVNSTRPGIRLLKLDGQTGKPVAGATFLMPVSMCSSTISPASLV